MAAVPEGPQKSRTAAGVLLTWAAVFGMKIREEV